MIIPSVHFVPRVGVAPATTTMQISGGGLGHCGCKPSMNGLGIQCLPVPSPPTFTTQNTYTYQVPGSMPEQPAQRAGATHYYDPYADVPQLKGASMLGLIDPNDRWHTGRNDGRSVDRGPYGTTALRISGGGGNVSLEGVRDLGLISNEVNRSINGGFGDIPTDQDFGRNRCYQPVMQGWIRAARPVAGLGSAGGDAIMLSRLGEDPDTVDQLMRMHRAQIIMNAITTAAVVLTAGLTIFTMARRKKK